MEMILDGVEPALALTGKVEVAIPGMRELRFRAIGQQQQRRGTVERPNADPCVTGTTSICQSSPRVDP